AVVLVDGRPEGGECVLGGPEGHHAATVRRLRPGETVHLSDGHGRVAECSITAAGREGLTLAVLGRTVTRPPQPRFLLVQALAKGDRGELAGEWATELGGDGGWGGPRSWGWTRWCPGRRPARWCGGRASAASGRWPGGGPPPGPRPSRAAGRSCRRWPSRTPPGRSAR